MTPRRLAPLSLVAGRAHLKAVVRPALAATTSVWIATANLKQLRVPAPGAGYHSVLSEFDRLARAGVELRLLHARMPSAPFREAFDRHPRLVAGGLELRMCPRVHLKCVVVDGQRLYLGSANWTGAGLGAKSAARRNFELGVVTDDALLIDEVQAYYDQIWRGAACAACGRRELCEAPLDVG